MDKKVVRINLPDGSKSYKKRRTIGAVIASLGCLGTILLLIVAAILVVALVIGVIAILAMFFKNGVYKIGG